MDEKHDNSPDNWSQEERQANYLDQTMKFTTEDLERERRRLREESRERFRQRHANQPLDGDYFDEQEQSLEEDSTSSTTESTTDSKTPKLIERMKKRRRKAKQASTSKETQIRPESSEQTNDLQEGGQLEQSEGAHDAMPSPQETDEIISTNEVINSEERHLEEIEIPSSANNDATKYEESEKQDDASTENQLANEDVVDDLSEELHEEPGPIVTDQAFHDTLQITDFQEKLGQAMEQEEDNSFNQDATEDSQHFVGGATWLTIGNILSRVIGALYVIPWATWLGQEYTQANTLYSVGYKPYSLFLAIATAGFPSAIAKQMAYFHSKNEYRVADKLFKNSMLIMVGTGLVSAALLFALAPILAVNSSTVNPEGAILVIRSLVPALIILPAMSLLRGYFQGFNDMRPTAISQVLEQLARVAYMLTATYAIMRVYEGTATTAVVHSTFAAFIGALIALSYLVVIYFRHRGTIREKVEASNDQVSINFKDSIQLMLRDSIPFILLGSGIIIIQLIDTYTFSHILERTSSLLLVEISELYGVLSLDVDKLMMIIVSLAVSMATAAVPAVTRNYSKGDLTETGELVTNITLIFLAVMLPAATGMAAIADNVYGFFYATGSESGPALLVTGALSSVALGAYTIFSTILQSMNYRRAAVKFLGIAILVKILLQYPLVGLLHAHGALLGTMIAFLISSILMWRKIDSILPIDKKSMRNHVLVIMLVTALMTVVALVWNLSLNALFGPVGRLLTFVKIFITVLIAALVYIVGLGFFGRLSLIIGDRWKDIQDKLRVF